MDFDLKTFLKNYKSVPKIDLKPYLKLDILEEFEVLNKKQLDILFVPNTYVRYVCEGDAFSDDDLESHVKCGGFFLAGGRYYGGKFEEMDNVCHWTHIQLVQELIPTISDDVKALGKRIFTIKLEEKHIFYRQCKFQDYE
jgi:hypothetical protein